MENIQNKGLKRAIAIILDIVFVALIAFAVYMLTIGNTNGIKATVLYVVIIVLIPCGFLYTYNSFAKEIDWDKPFREAEEEDEAEEVDEAEVDETEADETEADEQKE